MQSILTGNGKQYSQISNDAEESFDRWLAASSLSRKDFGEFINSSSLKIKENISDNGDISIEIISDNYSEQIRKPVPIICQIKGNNPEEFYLDALLILTYAASFYNNKKFINEINRFAKEKKIIN